LTCHQNSAKIDDMEYIQRLLESRLSAVLKRKKSVLLLGPRQTGKTTLLQRFQCDRNISLLRPELRLRYEKEPSLLFAEVEGLPSKGTRLPRIILDEIQRVPSLLDVVQELIDRRKAQFILTGSSARKLRHSSPVNLLPGRVIALRLDPFLLEEMPHRPLDDFLLQGSLPGIVLTASPEEKQEDLVSYSTVYLEEEVRAEALVRHLGVFARFLELAAMESGRIVNFHKMSQVLGISHTTVAAYYQILEDCLIVERVDPFTRSRTRTKLTKSSKYLFFDMGVRRVCAREGLAPPRDQKGLLFEHWVGLELIRALRVRGSLWRLRFWRDPDGPEVDWVLEGDKSLIPIEVKWTEAPTMADARHLSVFCQEYPEATEAYIICRTPHRMKLGKNVIAVSWKDIPNLIPL
jgi:predicted AAA+ superfamily ATPase